jgi:hypothetical protein
MSKHPSPRLDQLRAMREAKFARSLQSQRAEEKPAPAKRVQAPPEEPTMTEPAPAAPAKNTAAKKPKAAAKPPAKKKAKEKAKKKAG